MEGRHGELQDCIKPLRTPFFCGNAGRLRGRRNARAKPIDVDLDDPGSDGWQLRTGLIQVLPGEEVQNCYFFEVPFDREVYVSGITLAQNAGSHHMNVFRMKTIKALDGAPNQIIEGGECWNSPNWSDWPIIANSQNSGVQDWTLPEGVALKFAPREKIMLQSHYVNATTQKTPTDGKVVVNFFGLPEGSQPMELGTLFATNQQIEVCPGGTERELFRDVPDRKGQRGDGRGGQRALSQPRKAFHDEVVSSLTGEGDGFTRADPGMNRPSAGPRREDPRARRDPLDVRLCRPKRRMRRHQQQLLLHLRR